MIIPFINFAGQAAEAIALYETVFDVQNKQVMLYKDMPADVKHNFPPESEDRIMHAEMSFNGTLVWIGDSMYETTPGDRISIGVPLPTKEEVQTAFNKLRDAGGTVLMEPVPTFYSPLFGVVKDRFGVVWQFICWDVTTNP